jgi:5-methylcytosine-specific restriction endonuclease McrBC regulatory subunit McrC
MSSSTLPHRVQIRERDEKTIENCPPEIGEQLQRAAFDKVAANEFEKTRTTVGDDEEHSVVKATVEEDSLKLSVKDVVGVVNLTPTSKLQINPKIGWEDILEMFLAIQRRNRSLRYHGIPIEDFLSEDMEIDDIFVVIAINYLNSLQPIHRNGFIRRFESNHYNALTGRGRIDVEASLMNKVRGIPKHRFVEKEIDYATPVNSLIYSAGKQLLRLFQDGSGDFTHDQYFQIFSELREEIQYLEELNISDSDVGLSKIKRIDISDLPRQRRYYENAVKTSKTILSSTTGQSLASGQEDLTIDFILNMDQVFEKFTQVILEKEVDRLNETSTADLEGEVSIEYEPTLQIYDDNTVGTYRPDHVLKDREETVAVLDSKYYSQHNDPSLRGEERSRMFSYAFLLDTAEMAFLCPFGETRERMLERREGRLTLVRPGGDFSIGSYRDAIRDYLDEQFDVDRTIDQLEEDLEYPVVQQGVVSVDLDSLDEANALHMRDSSLISFARGVRRSTIRASNEVGRFDNLSAKQRRDLLDHIKQELDSEEKYDYCIPLFVEDSSDEPISDDDSDWTGESVKYYRIRMKHNTIAEVMEPKYIKLDW